MGLGYNIIVNYIAEIFSCWYSKSYNFIFLISIIISCFCIYYQYKTWLYVSDQSDSFYFNKYATALLSPLPTNSLLLINYDMQWTSVRYMQKCELLRPDVTVINLSMMTYSWFQYRKNLYPHLNFPAGYHSYENSKFVKENKAFTLSQFISANINQIPIYISGKLSFPDTTFDKVYEHVPIGLVSRIYQKNSLPTGTEYAKDVVNSWEVCSITFNFIYFSIFLNISTHLFYLLECKKYFR